MPQCNDFPELVTRISETSRMLKANAYAVINHSVTARAWLTGMYIVEYEQNGNDRAKYGEQLLKKLSERLGENHYSVSTLKDYRQFYLYYPQLLAPLAGYLIKEFPQQYHDHPLLLISQPVVGELLGGDAMKKSHPLVGVSRKSENQAIVGISGDGFAQQCEDGTVEPVPQMLFDRISYSQFALLIHIEDKLKRTFYAIETMRGPWSKRELKRQISSNFYERSGWSQKPELLSLKVNTSAEKPSFAEDLKSPYTFEFLGLASKDTITENDIEDAIVENFEDFIMELGMGFCLESRQKKMLIDNEYKKADLVFYHRILKCHVIVELKAHELEYADIMQLNLYIEYYRKHYMQQDDNPPIGLLLCTAYGKEMAEYLKPFTDPQLFIAKYELQLPAKEKIQQFLMRENTVKR